MKLKPLGDRVIVRAIEEEETTVSGIVLPDTAKEKPQKGKVLAVGDGKISEDTGKRIRRTSPKATRSCTASTAAPRSRSTVRNCWSCASPMYSPRSSPKGDQGHMPHKELKYAEDARKALEGGVDAVATRSRSRSAPRAGTWSSTRSSARHDHQRRCDDRA